MIYRVLRERRKSITTTVCASRFSAYPAYPVAEEDRLGNSAAVPVHVHPPYRETIIQVMRRTLLNNQV